MRILLDECVSEQLRHHFKEHECQTARYAGLAGLENGQLMRAAEAAGTTSFGTQCCDNNVGE